MYIYGGVAMLTKFSVENYKSFNKKISIDLSNSHDYDFNKNAINNEGIIKNAIIFGENGCGKSNFAFALFDIVLTLTDKNVDQRQEDIISFLNFNSRKKFATFSYEFLYNNLKIVYEYKKSSPKNIISEALKVNNEIIFDCDLKLKKFNIFNIDKIGYKSFNYDNYNFDISFIKYVLSYGSHNENSIIKFIHEFANKMLYFRSLQENAYIGIKNGTEFVIPWIIDHGYVKEFEEFLHNIANLNINLDTIVTDNLLPQKVLVVVNEERTKALNFEIVKSSGTQAMLLLFYWYKQLKDVSLLFIDEFDAFYHFSLSKKVIEMFKDMNGLQAIFTSHNTYIANNGILRPDCYFTIDSGNIKSFIDRTDRELREGHNLEKLLRSGEFNEENTFYN